MQPQAFSAKTKFKKPGGLRYKQKIITRWKAVLTPISENEKSRYKRWNPVSLGYVENQTNGTRDENSSAQHVIKNNLNYKTSTCAGNVQSQPFLPTQFPLPHRINALLASQMPKLSTLAYQKKWGNNSPCYTTHLYQPILNQSPKGTQLNFTSLGLRLSSHTSLFWTLPEQLAMLHHACVPTHPVPTSQDTPQTTNDWILQTHPHPTSQDTPLKISMFTL